MKPLCLAILILTSLSSKAVTLKEYIDAYLNNNQSVLNQKAAVQEAEANLEVVSDLWATSVGLTPSFQSAIQKFDSQSGSSSFEFLNENKGVDGSLNQGLPWGIDLELGASKNIRDQEEDFLGLDQSVNGSLSVDLMQNIGGMQDRARISAAEKRLEAEQINLQDAAIRACHEAVGVYANAKYAMERLRLFEAQYEAARRAFEIAERSYKQRIIRKIDLLSAKSDLVSSQAQLAGQQAETTQAIDNLFVEGGFTSEQLDLSNMKLQSPDEFMSFSKAATPAWKDSRRMKAAELLKASAKNTLRATEMANRSSLRAGVSADLQDRVSQLGSSGELFDQRNETVRVFLEMNWPFNKTNAARISEAVANQTRAEAVELETRKNLQSEYLALLRNEKALKVRLEASVARQKVLEERMKSGLKLVRSGKLDFDEYIRYANSFYTESSEQIRIRMSQIENKLGYFNFSSEPVELCKDVI